MRSVSHCFARTTLEYTSVRGSVTEAESAAPTVTYGRPRGETMVGCMRCSATDCSTRACMLSWMQRCWTAPACAHTAAVPTATVAAAPAAARRTRRAATLRRRWVLLLSTDMALQV
ncbi:GP63, leishmanolysin [Leishmania tarentolae]|uniref:GP63, leishmanolysin n=1 Tax=Leishmania tarentolae TaxID=5689 RepID=A0A640KB42_LEITA|nr:GP63, leishmanolysin [Leishmania tarentolae]GET86508.1 GP63, leishmanolysin [Leishmania tarentolae]GET93905.1 GP63, leishmanolysin [Leishmania tarentolae]